jgi:hypothetical protein
VRGVCEVTEQQTQQAIRLQLSRGPVRLWRNNTGLLYDRQGRPVSFGLCKGSSDLIGFRTITIGPEHVGRQLAVFCAIEVKSERGRATTEQKAFIEMVQAAGGLAGVARSTEDAAGILDTVLGKRNH